MLSSHCVPYISRTCALYDRMPRPQVTQRGFALDTYVPERARRTQCLTTWRWTTTSIPLSHGRSRPACSPRQTWTESPTTSLRGRRQREVPFVTGGQRWKSLLGRTFLGNQRQPQHCRRRFHWPTRMRTACTPGGHASRAAATRHSPPESSTRRTLGTAAPSLSAIARRRSRRSSSTSGMQLRGAAPFGCTLPRTTSRHFCSSTWRRASAAGTCWYQECPG